MKRRSEWGLASVSGVAVGLLVAMIVGGTVATVPADPAHAAEDPLTSSAVTLTNADALNPVDSPFPDLEVTVSQTKNLVSQGIRVSWTGGKKSDAPGGTTGGANFLQIAQCWGEDPTNVGHPDRRTCQYGGTLGAGSQRDGSTGYEDVAEQDEQYTVFSNSFLTPTYTGIPFVASNSAGEVDEKLAPADRVVNNLRTNPDGTVVKAQPPVNLNTNPFFTAFTTNEVKWAAAGADGSGSVPFEVQTAMQSPALGCGTPVVQADGSVLGQSCWIVVIPRGSGDSGSTQIDRSGLWWDSWEHHVAVKLEFKPLGVRCEIGEAERQLAGSELVGGAMTSWQPDLCLRENGAPFVLIPGNEADATVRAAGTEPSPLAFTSRPLDLSRVSDVEDPLAYAPVALSGVAISFSIDRQPHPIDATAEQKARAGLPLTEMKLTPRLVAKLLTASYVDSLPSGADKSHIGYKSFREPGKNARTIIQDPEFREINDDEWDAQIVVSASVADMLVPAGRSDLAVRLWEYVLADPEARAWLNGEPDKWGMIVNPWYSTDAAKNRAGVPLALPTESFPKADPIEKPDTTQTDPANGTGPINLVTWRPYTHSFSDGAYNVLRGDGLILGGWNKFSVPPKFDKSVRELFGSQKVIGATTAPAAALYQTVTASLRNPAGQFVKPTEEGMLAAAAAMTPAAGQSNVLQFDPTSTNAKAAATAYPLTMPVYAALNPLQTDAELRSLYANLIRYAVSEGQTPGTDIGELPPGYAPLPKGWVNKALIAADKIEQGIDPNAVAPAAPSGSSAGPSTPVRTSGVPVAQPVAAAPVPADPDATGQATEVLAGATTPDDPEIGPVAAAVPAGLFSGLAAALAVPLISRIRRRT